MADDAILLRKETYDRIMSVIQAVEKGDFVRVQNDAPITIVEIGANGEVTLGGSTTTTTTGGGSTLPDAPSPGTYVFGAIDGTEQWLSTESCECGGGGDLDGGGA